MPMLEVRPIQPTRRDAIEVAATVKLDVQTALARQEHGRGTLSERQERALQQYIDAITPERTLGRIARNPGQYYATYSGDEKVAVARFAEWNRYDQAAYENFFVGMALSALARFKSEHLSKPSFGILTLSSVRSFPRAHQEEAVDLLLQKAIELAEASQFSAIRIGIPWGDLLEPSEMSDILANNDFESTGKFAVGVPHVPILRQELYIRQDVS